MPKGYLRYYFLFFGLFDALALIIAFLYSMQVLDIYFSYFTVLSNMLVTTVFLYFGISKTKTPHKIIRTVYAPAVLYMSITGVIFWTILRHNHAIQTIPWINLTLHGVMPVAALIGWLLYSPEKKLSWKNALYWQSFPLLFVCYTLLRGPFAHWYPYPFLNPASSGGYIGVLCWVGGIITGSIVLSLFLIFLARGKESKIY